jgi:WD40 repeat protein
LQGGGATEPAPAAVPDLAADTSPGEGPDVFLSYSRRDQPFVLRLRSALEAAGWGVWVDEEDIPPAAEWRDELASGIRAAHTFVFVLSPDSVASDYCQWELEQAVALGKRLIPLVIRDIDDAPEEVAARQYVFMREQDDFDRALETLDSALSTDLEWVREHRQWLLAALRWDAQGRDRSLLLRGRDLKAAEAWLAKQGERTEPRPTPLQGEFLLASRAWETRRMQFVVGGVIVALAVTAVLGVLALLQRNDARHQAAIARSRELALSSTSQLPIDPERSLLLAMEAVDASPTAEADNALRQAVFSSRVRTAVPLQATRIGGLINAVAYSPDGEYVAGALKNGTVAIASSTTRRGGRAMVLPLAPLTADDPCSSFVSAAGHVAVAFSPDSQVVAAVNSTGWIHVWRWRQPGKPVTSPFCLGRATPPDTADVLAGLTGRSLEPAALTFVGNDVVALVEADGRVLTWPWETGAKPVLEGRSRGAILAAAFSEAGRETAIAEQAGISLLRSAGQSSQRLPERDAYDLAVSADGRTVAAVTGRRVVVWWPQLAAPPTVLHTPATIRAVATSRDGALVAAGDVGHAVRVWDLSRGRRPVVLAGSQGSVTAVAFSPDGRRLVSGGDDGVLRVWDWDAGRPPSLPGAASDATRFQLTREGRLLAVDPDDGRAAWVEAAGPLRRLEGVLQPAHVSVSRDGARAVAPVDEVLSDAIQLWDLDSGPQPRTTTVAESVNDVAVSPDGRWIALAGRKFRVSAWPGDEPRFLGPPELLQYSAAAFSPDSRRLAAAAFDGKATRIFVWDSPNGSTAPARTLNALGFTTALAFSDDGERLVASQTDGAVYIWDLSGDAVPLVLRGHPDGANGAAFSPDGSEVVSGGSDGTVRVWRLEGSPKSVAIDSGVGHIVAVAFTQDGTGVIAAGTDGSRMWTCDFCGSTDDVVAVAKGRATRALTADERALFLHDG